jgi:hypothetical protein
VEAEYNDFQRFALRPHLPIGYYDDTIVIVVLSTILEKLGNPSPDDPFNPDIAAVRLIHGFKDIKFTSSPGAQGEQDQVHGHGKGMDQKVGLNEFLFLKIGLELFSDMPHESASKSECWYSSLYDVLVACKDEFLVIRSFRHRKLPVQRGRASRHEFASVGSSVWKSLG